MQLKKIEREILSAKRQKKITKRHTQGQRGKNDDTETNKETKRHGMATKRNMKYEKSLLWSGGIK